MQFFKMKILFITRPDMLQNQIKLKAYIKKNSQWYIQQKYAAEKETNKSVVMYKKQKKNTKRTQRFVF